MNDLALFPLNTVLFPGGRLPLRIFEQRYMTMAKACLRDGSPFGVCAIREGKEVGDPAVPHGVGTLARIGEWDMPQLGVLQIVAQGGERFRILERRAQPDGLLVGDVEILPAPADAPPGEQHRVPVRILQRVIEEQPSLIAEPAPAGLVRVGQRPADRAPPAVARHQAGAPRARRCRRAHGASQRPAAQAASGVIPNFLSKVFTGLGTGAWIAC